MSAPIQRVNVLVTTFLTLALLVTLAGCTREGMFFLLAPRHATDVIVPNGYEGHILIAYQVPDGVEPERQGDVWIYRIQNDGVLLLRDEPPFGVGEFRFFYQMADGSLQPIPRSTCFDDVGHDGVVVCSTGVFRIYNAQPLRPLLGFFVGRLGNWRHFKTSYQESTRLYDRYFDQLVLPNE